MLYVLNDVLFHVKFRTHSHDFFEKVAPHLPALFKTAASFANAPKHVKKLQSLLQLWEKKSYFQPSVLGSLRAAVEEGPKSEEWEANGGGLAKKAHTTSTTREAPFLLPSMHGDPSTPWYDLPAANWLPVIEPNSTRPMNPAMIKPLQLAGGPADKNLVDAVKKLLGDVDKIYAKDTLLDGDSAVDVSQMGEFIERDELGDIVGGETYYGWSKTFCDKMRARRLKGDGMDIDDEQRGRRGSSRSSSRSRSHSRRASSRRDSSRPATKRRRLSRSRSRSWSSASRSRSRGRRGSYNPRRPRSYSRSVSRSRSPRRGQNGRDRPRSPSRGSYSPQPVLQNTQAAGYGPQKGFAPPNPQQYHNQHQQPPPPPPASYPPANFPTGAPPQPSRFNSWNAAVPPPPPPPHYQGQWPPPPPPPPHAGNHGPQQSPQGWFPPHQSSGGRPIPGPPPPGSWGGGWAPPPPPYPPQGHPEPQQQQPGGFQYGRGGNGGGGGYRGRGGGGGYGRGRGW